MPIAPDTKNWTWILDRQCPQCGFEAAATSRERIGPMIRDNAAAWRLVLAHAGIANRPDD